jgi:hypothetical protein
MNDAVQAVREEIARMRAETAPLPRHGLFQRAARFLGFLGLGVTSVLAGSNVVVYLFEKSLFYGLIGATIATGAFSAALIVYGGSEPAKRPAA